MLWPHQPLFPYRYTLFKLGCAIGIAGAFLWPGLTSGQRFLTLVTAFLGIMGSFLASGFLLILLRVIPVLHAYFALFLFYVSLASTATSLLEAGYSLIVGDNFDPSQRALTFSLNLCGSMGVLAAANGAINRKVPSKNALERVREQQLP